MSSGPGQVGQPHQEGRARWLTLTAVFFVATVAVLMYGTALTGPVARGDAETVLRPSVRQGDHHEQPAIEAPASLEDAVEVPAHAQTPLALEPLTHDPARLPNSGRQSLPTFLPPPLQDQTASLGPHPNQESVSPLPLAVVGLKRPFHGKLQ